MTDPQLHHAIGRLLGPAAPEVSCDECFARLDAYVDRELRAGDAEQAMPALAAHLRGCPACAEDHDSLRAFVLAEQRSAHAPGERRVLE
jgi:anti-sigma factor RsiW